MKNFIELSKLEAIQVQGGSLYSFGQSVGGFFANTCDFMAGFYTGLMH